MTGAFILWLSLAPPALLTTLRKLDTGQRFTSAQEHQSAVIRLAGMFHQTPHRYPPELLRQPLPPGPVAIYATDRIGWTLGANRDAIHYELQAWNDAHFFQPPTADCARQHVWEDPRRHAVRHDWYAAAGPAGLRLDFLAHLHRDLAAGRTVLFAPVQGWPMRNWVASDSSLRPIPTDNPHLWQIQLRSP
jgi:hypothetical protein